MQVCSLQLTTTNWICQHLVLGQATCTMIPTSTMVLQNKSVFDPGGHQCRKTTLERNYINVGCVNPTETQYYSSWLLYHFNVVEICKMKNMYSVKILRVKCFTNSQQRTFDGFNFVSSVMTIESCPHAYYCKQTHWRQWLYEQAWWCKQKQFSLLAMVCWSETWTKTYMGYRVFSNFVMHLTLYKNKKKTFKNVMRCGDSRSAKSIETR